MLAVGKTDAEVGLGSPAAVAVALLEVADVEAARREPELAFAVALPVHEVARVDHAVLVPVAAFPVPLPVAPLAVVRRPAQVPRAPFPVLAVARPTEPPVLLGTNTKVCLTGRSFSRVSVKFGMTTQQIAGMVAGKYSFSLSAEELAGNDGEFKVEVPLSKFREETNFGDSPVGKELTDWWCVAGSTSAKVEITGVELIE